VSFIHIDYGDDIQADDIEICRQFRIIFNPEIIHFDSRPVGIDLFDLGLFYYCSEENRIFFRPDEHLVVAL